MTSSPSPGGTYRVRDVRNLYPVVTDNHLRYLDKWGLVRQAGASMRDREYSFSDLLTIKQLAAELDRGVPLKVILRGLLAERQGQLALDFHATADTPRAKVLTLQEHRPRYHAVPDTPGAVPLRSSSSREASLPGYPFADPQAALAAKYFLERDEAKRKVEETKRPPSVPVIQYIITGDPPPLGEGEYDSRLTEKEGEDDGEAEQKHGFGVY